MRSRPWQRNSSSGRGWWIALAVVLLVMVVGRLVAPSAIKAILNKSLANMTDGYQGTVDDVAIRMLDAEIGLVGLKIVKKNGLVPVPFMQMKELVLGTVRDSWKLRSVMRAIEPNASFVDAKSEARKQKGPPDTLDNLSKQLPFELLRVEIEDGQYHFRNFEAKPEVDAYLSGVNVVWDKLVGCLPPGGSACRSNLEGRASVMKTGKLKFKGTFARTPEVDFHLDAALDDLRVPELNAALAQYAKVDVKKGTADVDVRYDRRGKGHDILLVPALSDFDVVGSKDGETKFFRELGLATAASYFERKNGEKAVSIKSKPSGGMDFELIDRPKKPADKAK
jgi:hypothetical protein